jgi:hypothetical protein
MIKQRSKQMTCEVRKYNINSNIIIIENISIITVLIVIIIHSTYN